MRMRMALVAGVALIALAACSRRDPDLNIAGAEYNKQTGVITTKQGISFNTTSAVGGCLSGDEANSPPSAFTPERRVEIVSCFQTQTEQQLNPQLPRQIDPITRLDRVTASGPMLTYNYTISRSAESLGPNPGQRIETMIRGMACSQPAARQAMELGGIYAYRYVDNQGQLIHSFQISSC